MPAISFQSMAEGGSRFAASSLAPRIAEYALTLCIAVLAGFVLLSIFAPLPTPKGDALAAVSAAAPRTQAALVAVNPFPNAPAVVSPVDAAPDVADTALDLVLTGVWPAEGGGSAIIRTPDGQEHRFASGDEIVSGARLAAVYSDQVIIERGGAREALRFEKKTAFNQPPPRPAAAQSAAGADDFDLSTYIRFGPGVDAAGAPAIALFPGRNADAFARMGFRSKDILRRINGAEPPANPGALPSFIASITQSGAANIVVERDGVETTIVMSLNDTGIR